MSKRSRPRRRSAMSIGYGIAVARSAAILPSSAARAARPLDVEARTPRACSTVPSIGGRDELPSSNAALGRSGFSFAPSYMFRASLSQPTSAIAAASAARALVVLAKAGTHFKSIAAASAARALVVLAKAGTHFKSIAAASAARALVVLAKAGTHFKSTAAASAARALVVLAKAGTHFKSIAAASAASAL